MEFKNITQLSQDELLCMNRLVVLSSPKWNWMKGMVLDDGAVVLWVTDDERQLAVAKYNSDLNESSLELIDSSHVVPDFDHPATIGCVETLVKRIYGEWYSPIGLDMKEVGGEVAFTAEVGGILWDKKIDCLVDLLITHPPE